MDGWNIMVINWLLLEWTEIVIERGIDEDIKGQVKEYIKETQAAGGIINTAITLVAAKGLVLTQDDNILAEKTNTWDWAKRLMAIVGLVTTVLKITPEEFTDLKSNTVMILKQYQKWRHFPTTWLLIGTKQQRIMYLYLTGLKKWGRKQVQITSTDDRRLLTVTTSGEMLPAQQYMVVKLVYPEAAHYLLTKSLGQSTYILLPYITRTHQKLKTSQYLCFLISTTYLPCSRYFRLLWH